MNWTEHIEPFHAELVATGRSTATARSYASDARKFCAWVDETPPPSEGVDDYGHRATAFVQELRVGGAPASSVLRYMASLRAFYRYLEPLTPVTPPFVGYRSPKPGRPVAHPLPNLKVDVDSMVLAAWRPHHKMLIGLCGYAGLRVSEARSMTPRSLIQDENGNHWLAVHGKGGTYREVPVTQELLAILRSVPVNNPDQPDVPIADRTARKVISDIAKRAEISRDVSSHDLRHTFGSEIYNKTKDLRVTQELLGHQSSQTTEGYTGVDAEAKRQAVMEALG